MKNRAKKIAKINAQLKAGDRSSSFVRIKHYKNVPIPTEIGRIDNFSFILS